MASFEKQKIPLEDISQPNEGILDPDIKLSTSSTDLVDTKLSSRRRKVVIILVVIVIITVIAVAGFLIGKYVSASKDDSKQTKPSPGATTRNFTQGQTSTLPGSLTSATVISSMSESPTMTQNMSRVMSTSSAAGQTVTVTRTAETKPSPGFNFTQVQTSTLTRMPSLTSAAVISSMSESPTMTTNVSRGMSTSSLYSSV